MIQKKHRHIIWDWNGTLVNDTAFCTELLNQSLRKYNLPEINICDYQNRFHFPVESFYRELGFLERGVTFEEISFLFIENYRSGWEHCLLQDESIEIFDLLKQCGKTQSILSASKQGPLEEYIDHFNIRHHFTDLIGVQHHYASGKEAEGLAWIRKKNLNPKEMLLIGDTVHDYEVAQHLGTDCILVSHGHYCRERLESTGALIIDSFRELLEDLRFNY